MEKDQGLTRIKDLGRMALQANEEHQQALKRNIHRLEVEVDKVDKLLDSVDVTDDSDREVGGSVIIPGSIKATAPISTRTLSSIDSPFYNAARKCNLYQSWSEVHPMKTKEIEALAEAVRTENYRRHALDLRKSGPAFSNSHGQDTPSLESDREGLNWDRIADKMSAISMFNRSSEECRVRWLGEHHPELNHEPWTQEEIIRVKALATGFANGQPDWVVIANKLGTKRTPLDCMRHATTRKSHQWSSSTDERLLRAIHMYGRDNWHLVARYVSEDATPQQCSNRFQRTIDPSIKRTVWTPEEDARLCTAVAAYGSSWISVAACVPGRHNDQCRDHWIEQLNTNINGCRWTEAEDMTLLHHVHALESTSWKDIAERLGNGKTEDKCRARYFSLRKGDKSVHAVSSMDNEDRIDLTSKGTGAASSEGPTSSQQTDITDNPQCLSYLSSSTTLPGEEYGGPRVVFLDPVVSSDPKLHKYRRPRPPRNAAKIQITTLQEPQSSTSPDVPPLPKKRRKKR